MSLKLLTLCSLYQEISHEVLPQQTLNKFMEHLIMYYS